VDVKPGYKQTDLGVIPEDWGTRRIKSLSMPVRGGSPRPAGDSRYFNGSYIPWLTVAALTNIPASQLMVSETASKLTKEGALYSRTLTKGTLIIANSGATLGVAKILGITSCANDGIAALLNLDKHISPIFLAHFINTKTGYLRDKVATGNGQPNLNTELIGDIQIPLPPTLTEQEAIAEALSDADALIESLEQLLTKKRQIKQGAMQELLTGKKRLPGFSGEWVEKRLRDFGKTYGGLTGKSKRDFGQGDARYITFMNIMNNVVIDCEQFEQVNVVKGESQNQVKQWDLFFNGSSETPEEVGLCSVLKENLVNVYLNSFCFGLRCGADTEVHRLYLAYYFRSSEGRELLKSLAQGATRYNLSKVALIDLEFPFPTLAEQEAIANVLSEMDDEIAALEAKLNKARNIKQGMMQELLTGRIRLV
jgi:type I restriction enzyme S subunit